MHPRNAPHPLVHHDPTHTRTPTCAHPPPHRTAHRTPTAGAAYAASVGGHLFKLEDIALGGWLEWLAAERGIEVQRIKDKRCSAVQCSGWRGR